MMNEFIRQVFDIKLQNKIRYRWPPKFADLPAKDARSFYASDDEIIMWNELDEENQQFSE